jgi:hypothetical protein
VGFIALPLTARALLGIPAAGAARRTAIFESPWHYSRLESPAVPLLAASRRERFLPSTAPRSSPPRRAARRACLSAGIFAVALLAAGGGRAGVRAAVMPLAAEALLPSTREALERDLRAAIRSHDVEVQPASETRGHIEEGARSGLDCALTRDECAVRVGLIADVDVVVTAAVEVVAERTVLRAGWLDVHGKAPRRIAGALVLPAVDGGASLKNLVRLLVEGAGEPVLVPVRTDVAPPTSALSLDGRSAGAGVLWLLPGHHLLRAEAPDRTPLERDLEVRQEGIDEPVLVALPPLPVDDPLPVTLAAGLGVGISGAVIGGVAGAVVLFLESDLQRVMPLDERRGRQTAGVASVVVAGIGGAMALTGLGLSLVGMSE